MVDEKSLQFTAVSFDEKPWYEVDTIHDLAEAEKLFPVVTAHEIACAVH
jgi:hypothetical protein